MDSVKNLISNEIERIKDLISNNTAKDENIKYKNELHEALYWLNIATVNSISKDRVKNIFKIPLGNTGYSEYRIINDCESDDPVNWIEITAENENLRLNENDLIIKLK